MKQRAIWNLIDKTLHAFRLEFSREKAYIWFVIIIVSLMISTEASGVTSIVRELSIDPLKYESMLLFFRANSWNLQGLIQKWQEIMSRSNLLYKEGPLNILIGDGTKVAKQGKKMPGVKKLHQESENTTKPTYIFGQLVDLWANRPGSRHSY